ncbi:MAG: DUF1697 domain-containing protein [Burkholderiaceae bacterium]|nr:DUF1697 domain-containing protein [Microbacteriaceae bacterium]
MPATSAFTHVALLRGINVGGRNPVAMPELAACFRDGGYGDARTYIQSGNVLFTAKTRSGDPKLEAELSRMLEARFALELTVVVRSRDELAATIAAAPPGHGSPDLRSDVYFLQYPLTAEEAFALLPDLREGVDSAAMGPGALYFSRVAARARETRITSFLGKPVFRRITVRNWRTTTRLLEMLDEESVPS